MKSCPEEQKWSGKQPLLYFNYDYWVKSCGIIITMVSNYDLCRTSVIMSYGLGLGTCRIPKPMHWLHTGNKQESAPFFFRVVYWLRFKTNTTHLPCCVLTEQSSEDPRPANLTRSHISHRAVWDLQTIGLGLLLARSCIEVFTWRPSYGKTNHQCTTIVNIHHIAFACAPTVSPSKFYCNVSNVSLSSIARAKNLNNKLLGLGLGLV